MNAKRIEVILKAQCDIMAPIFLHKRMKENDDPVWLAKPSEEKDFIDAQIQRLERQFMQSYSGYGKKRINGILKHSGFLE